MVEKAYGKVVEFQKPAAEGNGNQKDERLNSWKEIATYLSRGTRTVQRWEREEALPVHRLQHAKLGSVYAYRSELDKWWVSRRVSLESKPNAPAPEEETIAVLPFTDLSAERDQGYFCEGVAEEILNSLSRIKALRVASRMSSFRISPGVADVREVGRRLHVRNILEGSVRKAGNRLRIAVRLTDTETGYQRWAEQYDREWQDIFVLQDEIAREVADALEIRLGPGECAAAPKQPTTDPKAYDFYLRGHKYYYQYGVQDIESARVLFQEAIEQDPNYALAWAGLADCWSYSYLYSRRTDEARRQAEVASRRAVELDPGCAAAQTSRGMALSLAGRDAEAEQAFAAAIRLDSQLFEAYYFRARHYFVRGELEAALADYEQASRIRPDDYQAPLLMAQIYEDLGRPELARQVRRHGVEVAEQLLKLAPDDARAMYMAANGLVALGEHERGRLWAERALKLRPEEPMLLYNVGCIYSMLGQVEQALDCLEKAVANGLSQRGWFEHDSNLDRVRSEGRFQELMGRLG